MITWGALRLLRRQPGALLVLRRQPGGIAGAQDDNLGALLLLRMTVDGNLLQK